MSLEGDRKNNEVQQHDVQRGHERNIRPHLRNWKSGIGNADYCQDQNRPGPQRNSQIGAKITQRASQVPRKMQTHVTEEQRKNTSAQHREGTARPEMA